MNGLILQLFSVFAPIVGDIITRYRETHNGTMPTGDQIRAEFEANIQKYLSEGEAWLQTHPRPPAA